MTMGFGEKKSKGEFSEMREHITKDGIEQNELLREARAKKDKITMMPGHIGKGGRMSDSFTRTESEPLYTRRPGKPSGCMDDKIS